jgi:hypothetical protein
MIQELLGSRVEVHGWCSSEDYTLRLSCRGIALRLLDNELLGRHGSNERATLSTLRFESLPRYFPKRVVMLEYLLARHATLQLRTLYYLMENSSAGSEYDRACWYAVVGDQVLVEYCLPVRCIALRDEHYYGYDHFRLLLLGCDGQEYELDTDDPEVVAVRCSPGKLNLYLVA